MVPIFENYIFAPMLDNSNLDINCNKKAFLSLYE